MGGKEREERACNGQEQDSRRAGRREKEAARVDDRSMGPWVQALCRGQVSS